MTSTHPDKVHLGPLLEFLRFVSQRGRESKSRFPKRINGAAVRLRDYSDSELDQESSNTPVDYATDFPLVESLGNSAFVSPDNSNPLPAVADNRKRSRSPFNELDTVSGTNSSLVVSGNVEKSPERRLLRSKFLEFTLGDLGLELLIDINRVDVDESAAERVKGMRCCYLLVGTSMIVSGEVTDVSLTEKAALVTPDPEIRVEKEWVPLGRVYVETKYVEVAREEVARRIKCILEAEIDVETSPAK